MSTQPAVTPETPQTQAITLPPDIERLVPAVVRRAEEISIESAEDYEEAQHALKFVAGSIKKFVDTFDTNICNPAYKLWKGYVAFRDERVKPMMAARKIIEGKLGEYERIQEEARLAREAQLRAEAKRKADEEAIAQAAALEQAGETEAAQQMVEQALAAPPPVVVVESALPTVQGVSKAKPVWKWRVAAGKSRLDAVKAIAAAAAKNPNLWGLLDLNDTVLNQQAKSLTTAACIPCVEVYDEKSRSVRAA